MDFNELYRKTEIKNIGNAVFGGTTETLEIDIESYDYISNFVLYIKLPKLTNSTTPTDGYINWVDSIGHALIEGIEFKIGNEVILDLNIPYGNWLDITNELIDATRNEWSLVGKNSSIQSLKKYANTYRIYHVPLKLPFTNNDYNLGIQSLLPLYLLNSSSNFKIRFKLRSLAGLVLVSGDGNSVPTEPAEGSLEVKLYYDTYKYSDYQIKQNNISKYSLSGYENYFDIIEYQRKSYTDLIYFSQFKNSTIKDLIFVFQQINRSSTDSTPIINDPEIITDINGNDWFNYTSDSFNSDYGYSDPINTINKLSINNEDEVEDSIDSLYFRNVLPSNYYLNKPKKHIYTYPMKTSRFSKKGLITVDNYDIKFEFTNNMTNSSNFRILVFATTVKKIVIQNNRLSVLDIDLDYEKNEILQDLSGASISQNVSFQNLDLLKDSLKKELLEILSSPKGDLISNTIKYEKGTTEKQEKIIENGKEIIIKKFPDPITLKYKLCIPIVIENDNNLYLVFSKTSELNKKVPEEKEQIIKQFYTFHESLTENKIKNIEIFVRNELDKNFINQLFDQEKNIMNFTFNKPNNFDNLFLIKLIGESVFNNTEQNITIPQDDEIPSNINDLLNIFLDKVKIFYNNSDLLNKNKLKTFYNYLDEVIDSESNDNKNNAISIKKYLISLEKISELIIKIKKFNEYKKSVEKRLQQLKDTSQPLQFKKYEKKEFIKNQNDYTMIESIDSIEINELKKKIIDKLKSFLVDIYESSQNTQRFNILSTLLYNLYNEYFDQEISKDENMISKKEIINSLNLFTNKSENLSILKINIDYKIDKFISTRNNMINELKQAFDEESNPNSKKITNLIETPPQNSVQLTDALFLKINPKEISDNIKMNGILLSSNQMYNFFNIKKLKLNKLAQEYNISNNKEKILENIKNINNYNKNNILSKLEFVSKNKSNSKFILIIKRFNKKLNVSSNNNLFTLKDINSMINNLKYNLEHIHYFDNYTENTQFEGTLLITIT